MDEFIASLSAELVTVGIGALILGAAWGVAMLSKVALVSASLTEEQFNWKQFFRGLSRAIVWATSMLGFVVVLELLTVFSQKVDLDITGLIEDASTLGVIGITLTATAQYLVSAYHNIKQFLLGDESSKINIDGAKPDYQGIAEAFRETITGLTTKQYLTKEGVEDFGKEFSDEEIGQGGFVNTYPEPYRSAPKDSLVDPSTCYSRECVSYCAWKICELTGLWPVRTGSMSAKYWVDRLPSWGYQEVGSPRNGGKYVGVYTGGTYGHVVWFENDNTISEYNYNSLGNYGVREINLNSYRWYEVQAPYSPTPTPTDIEVGDTVTLKSWTDYTGVALVKTRDYYYVSQISGDRAVLNADEIDGPVYAAVNVNNLEKVEPAHQEDPTPTPTNIEVGDSVWAWGQGTSDAYGGGRKTKDFPKTKMKVIMIINGRYALNQYNKGTIGNPSAVTGWWTSDQIEAIS